MSEARVSYGNWYRSPSHCGRVIESALKVQAASADELWNQINSTGIAGTMGIPNRQHFNQMLRQPGTFEQIGQHAKSMLPAEERSNLQQAYTNYTAGRLLGEEIRRVRDFARMQGREPSVAEMRAARRTANERLVNEGGVPGLGIPQEFSVGKRGPLARKPRLKERSFEPEPVTDAAVQQMADSILNRELSLVRQLAAARYSRGEASSPEPTAAEVRSAIRRANETLKQMGITDGTGFSVGSRGPVGTPKLQRKVTNEEEFYSKKDRMRENLGLEPVLDIEPGNTPIPIPSDPTPGNALPEQIAIDQREQERIPQKIQNKRLQSEYSPQPPLHDSCRCQIQDLGGGYLWKTEGDACPECIEHQQKFNAIGAQMSLAV